jgi:hypothetical protein
LATDLDQSPAFQLVADFHHRISSEIVRTKVVTIGGEVAHQGIAIARNANEPVSDYLPALFDRPPQSGDGHRRRPVQWSAGPSHAQVHDPGVALLTAIVALASGWWTNRNNLKRQTADAALWEYRAEAVKELASFAGCDVSWDEDNVSGHLPTGAHYSRSTTGLVYVDP